MDLNALTSKLRDFRSKKDWSASLQVLSGMQLTLYSGDALHAVLDEFFMALFYSQRNLEAEKFLLHYERTYVDDHIINNTDYLLQQLRNGKKLVATFDVNRLPKDNEIVICYGNFPQNVYNLVCCNPMRRHVKYFSKLTHDVVESDPSWSGIDCIAILNQEQRVDRYTETLLELCRVKAPLDKVKKFPSTSSSKGTADPKMNAVLSCSKGHLQIVKECLEKKYSNVLVLEDDFMFTSDAQLSLLPEVLKRDYDVCLLAYSKYGSVESFDDLFNRNGKRESTTCSGYLVSSSGVNKLVDIWSSACAELEKTNDMKYACDRSWLSMAEGKFYFLKRKMGMQRPSYDYQTGKMIFHMD